jgi:Ca2+-binding EF-hand superfamily protein
MSRNLRARQETIVRGPSRSAQGRDDKVDYATLPDFTRKEIGEIRQAFELFDKSGKGVVFVADMIKYLKELGVDQSYPTVYMLCERMSKEFPKGCSFREFMEHMQFYFGDIKSGSGLTRFFELLDYTESGTLTVEDLERVAREIGENVDRDEIMELIEDFYECPNMSIDVDSFYKMMSKSTF